MMIPSNKHWIIWILFYFLINLCSFSTYAGDSDDNFEAAFQGECQSNGPCQHLCFDLHDGTFECACRPGYTLSHNGYACLENSPIITSSTGQQSPLSSLSSYFNINTNQSTNKSKKKNYPSSSTTSNEFKRSRKMQKTINLTSGTFKNNYYNNKQNNSPFLSSSLSLPLQIHSQYRDQVYNSCDKIECEAGGICVKFEDSYNHRVRCKCPLGRGGFFCEKPMEVRFPRFHGRSYLALPTLRNAHKMMQVTIEFKPEYHDGILLYSGEKQNLEGDFIAIILYQGLVEFRFDCGMGEGIVRSSSPVVLNSWNKLTVVRDGWSAWLQLNSKERVYGQSQGLFTHITFKLELFLGGSPNMSLTARRASSRLGFVGCVRELTINGHSYDFRSDSHGDAIDGIDIDECNAGVCSNTYCMNGGQCVATSPDKGICLCPLGFAGNNCESKSQFIVPSFNGSSYLQFTGLRGSSLSFLEIEMIFRPTESNGLLLYNGNRMNGGDDFVSLNLVDGYVEFRFDLGSGPAIIRNRKPIELNQWHSLIATRTGTQGSLRVDDEANVIGNSVDGFTQLSLALNLFIGGVTDSKDVSTRADAKYSFSGCIKKVIINGRSLGFHEALSGVNVVDCYASRRSCENVDPNSPDMSIKNLCQSQSSSYQQVSEPSMSQGDEDADDIEDDEYEDDGDNDDREDGDDESSNFSIDQQFSTLRRDSNRLDNEIKEETNKHQYHLGSNNKYSLDNRGDGEINREISAKRNRNDEENTIQTHEEE
ncbi:pikachurin-like [Brevipalpus obovatus]|uniref:pikachurin-like n=1 Tax=Brevipalpus obovatus TaxID=246614 RepID=UPI003D9EFDB9